MNMKKISMPHYFAYYRKIYISFAVRENGFGSIFGSSCTSAALMFTGKYYCYGKFEKSSQDCGKFRRLYFKNNGRYMNPKDLFVSSDLRVLRTLFTLNVILGILHGRAVCCI